MTVTGTGTRSDSGTGTGTRSESGTGNGNGTEEYGICGQSVRGRWSGVKRREASENGTGIKSAILQDRERTGGDLDPESERRGGGSERRAGRGRAIRRVRDLCHWDQTDGTHQGSDVFTAAGCHEENIY